MSGYSRGTRKDAVTARLDFRGYPIPFKSSQVIPEGEHMANERLRDSLQRNGLTTVDVADRLGVDPKTVERWITQGRTPYPRHRHSIAALVRESVTYIWPTATSLSKTIAAGESEVLKVYPHRHSVPADLWRHLLQQATDDVAILVYVGMFLTEAPDLINTLRRKANDGTRVRLLFGEPKSDTIVRRSEEEGIGPYAIPAKIRNSLAIFRPLVDVEGVEIRCHGTTLYNSIFRYDDEMIVNTHIYGVAAPHAPALHLRRLTAGELFNTYMKSYEAVWNDAKSPTW
jgi:transcriptional regulator with XRE-family HTH domain